MVKPIFEAVVFEQGAGGVSYPLVGPEPYLYSDLLAYYNGWVESQKWSVRLWGVTKSGEHQLIASHAGTEYPLANAELVML